MEYHCGVGRLGSILLLGLVACASSVPRTVPRVVEGRVERGPIVSPKHRALLVTPVAPHMLFDRSLVLDPTEAVEVEIEVRDGSETTTMPWNYAYFEIAERGEVVDHRLDNFLGPHEVTELPEVVAVRLLERRLAAVREDRSAPRHQVRCNRRRNFPVRWHAGLHRAPCGDRRSLRLAALVGGRSLLAFTGRIGSPSILS